MVRNCPKALKLDRCMYCTVLCAYLTFSCNSAMARRHVLPRFAYFPLSWLMKVNKIKAFQQPIFALFAFLAFLASHN